MNEIDRHNKWFVWMLKIEHGNYGYLRCNLIEFVYLIVVGGGFLFCLSGVINKFRILFVFSGEVKEQNRWLLK